MTSARIGARNPDDPRYAYPDEAVRDWALKAGVVCYRGKPVDDFELEQCLLAALKRAPPL